MKITARSLGLIGLLGGVAGAINAWLCYAKIPVPVVNPSVFGDVTPSTSIFSWSIIPAGAAHGAILAGISVGLATLFWKHSWPVRLIGVPLVGWVAGWLSFIPFWMYISDEWIWKALVWPIAGLLEAHSWYFLCVVPCWAGTVGLAYYVVLNVCNGLSRKGLSAHVFFGGISASLGSLAWWRVWQPEYFSVLHGTIWGALVGFGVWRAQRSPSEGP